MRWPALALAIMVLWAGIRLTSADHNVYLPYASQTPLAKQIKQAQEYTYCLDSRAANYPNFASQLADVNNQYAERVGIRSRQVAFGDSSCQVKHTMPVLTCDGWAARIFYANWPVEVQYCVNLGYQDWRSAQGHELGHGLLGLHEQYNDSGPSIGCTGRTNTVMDCASGVRYPQALDVDRGCALILTSWCGSPVLTEPTYTDCTTYPGWEGTVSCYWPSKGKWLWSLFLVDGREQVWEWSNAQPAWRCVSGCP